MDPLTKSFPWWTPYQFAGNQPIWAVDLDGLEIDISTFKKYLNNGKLDWHITNHDFLQKPGPLGDGYLMIKDNEDGTYNYEYSNITDDTYEYYSGQCNVTSLALGFSVLDLMKLSSVISNQREGGLCSTNISKSTIDLVIPITSWKTQAPGECFQACKSILIDNGIQNPAPKSMLIQMTQENENHTDLEVSATAVQGIMAIDRSLESGSPIIVGVNHTLNYKINEGTTDHFVVIVGRGIEDSQTYYRFFDVGTTRQNSGTSENNKLFLNTDGTLTGSTDYSKTKQYTVSQVRPNN